MEKRYVARVLGEFPEEGLSVENYLDWDPKMNCASVLESSGIILVAYSPYL